MLRTKYRNLREDMSFNDYVEPSQDFFDTEYDEDVFGYDDGLDDEEFEDFGEETYDDVEDPSYWDDAVEIDPDTAWEDTEASIRGGQQYGYYDNFNDHDAGESGAYGIERFRAAQDLANGKTPKEINSEVDEDYSGYSGDYAEPAHYDDDFLDAMNPKNYEKEQIKFGNY